MNAFLTFGAPQALVLALFWPGLTMAQGTPPTATDQEISPIDCALISDGVQRLACYDSINSPNNARDQASDKQVEDAEQAADTLAPARDNVEEAINKSDGEGSDGDEMTNMVDRHLKAEKALFSFSGGFISYRPTYILPITWASNPNKTPTSPRLGATEYDYSLKHEEAKYQISFKVPLLTGLLEDRTTLWFGYTQRSFWQFYNQGESAPFRETNYEPEVFLRHQADWDLGGLTLSNLTLGLNHQSNGLSEPRSRSWNRVMASVSFTGGRWLFAVQPWYRIPENSQDDDNEDIASYLGHANYNIVYKLSEDQTFSLRLTNNLRSDNRTSIDFGFSFPMGDTVKGFFQYYNGYGESLIDYNHRIKRFGFGIMLNDWL